RIVERTGVAEALVECRLRVVGAYDDRERGPSRLEIRDSALVPPPRDPERRFGRSVGVGESEMPALHGGIAHPPLVSPRERAGSCDPALHRGLELGRERVGLSDLAGAGPRGIRAQLAENQRAVSGEVVEPGQVPPE